jgi:ATPase subunit of ABC transporter with duplicated ATPase domains
VIYISYLIIPTIEEIEEALKSFNGAILSISHDLSFLQRVGIEESYVISGKKLKRLSNNPDDGVYFREELLSTL